MIGVFRRMSTLTDNSLTTGSRKFATVLEQPIQVTSYLTPISDSRLNNLREAFFDSKKSPLRLLSNLRQLHVMICGSQNVAHLFEGAETFRHAKKKIEVMMIMVDGSKTSLQKQRFISAVESTRWLLREYGLDSKILVAPESCKSFHTGCTWEGKGRKGRFILMPMMEYYYRCTCNFESKALEGE